jgi:hypothetical protein
MPLIQPTRRVLLRSLIGIIAAPAAIRVADLMPIKPEPVLWTASGGDVLAVYWFDYGENISIVPRETCTVECGRTILTLA